MLLLNDIQDDKRLAYLLSPTLARYPGRRRSRRGPGLALLGAGIFVLFFLWELLKRH